MFRTKNEQNKPQIMIYVLQKQSMFYDAYKQKLLLFEQTMGRRKILLFYTQKHIINSKQLALNISIVIHTADILWILRNNLFLAFTSPRVFKLKNEARWYAFVFPMTFSLKTIVF